jgi:hypothetical protein
MFLPSASYREYRRYLRYRRRRRGLALAITLALVGLIAALLHGHSRLHGHTRHHAARPSRAVSPAHRAPRTGTSSSPATAGQDLSWADFHGIELPVSAHDGPRDTSGGLAQGFTDTPRGALLAAINIGVRTAALWGPGIYTPTITRQVTGPDATALLNADTRDYNALRAAAHVPAGQPAGRGYAVEAAYRFVAWTPADATVDVVTEGPGSGGATVLAATRIEVVWQHGDWRLMAPPGGNWASSATSISSLTGYTTFPNEG